jgi:hypothetical protein
MALGFVLIALVGVFSLLYLSQSNKMALKGYDISTLEKERAELVAERERLEIESSRLQSIQEIQKGLDTSGMVPVKKINYIPATTSVALNQ